MIIVVIIIIIVMIVVIKIIWLIIVIIIIIVAKITATGLLEGDLLQAVPGELLDRVDLPQGQKIARQKYMFFGCL